MKQWGARPADVEAAMVDLAVSPLLLPPGCVQTQDFVNARHYQWKTRLTTLTIISEVEVVDGELWHHVSVKAHEHARRWKERGGMVTVGPVGRLPTWDELVRCKELCMGAAAKAVQVIPPRAEYVNRDPYVLHLYASLERDPLPDFRGTDSTGYFGI